MAPKMPLYSANATVTAKPPIRPTVCRCASSARIRFLIAARPPAAFPRIAESARQSLLRAFRSPSAPSASKSPPARVPVEGHHIRVLFSEIPYRDRIGEIRCGKTARRSFSHAEQLGVRICRTAYTRRLRLMKIEVSSRRSVSRNSPRAAVRQAARRPFCRRSRPQQTPESARRSSPRFPAAGRTCSRSADKRSSGSTPARRFRAR